MIINGRERHFLLTVKAANLVAELCPGNDFNNFTKITEGKTFSEIVETDLKIAEILINEYEQNQAIENKGYVPDLVKLDEFKDSSLITPFWIHNLEMELVQTIMRDAFGKIDTEETKEAKKGKKKRKRGGQVLSLQWILFYGYKMGMNKPEILHTRRGEMLDLLACNGIYNGMLQEKERKMTYDEVMALR